MTPRRRINGGRERHTPGDDPGWMRARIRALVELIEFADYRGHDPFDLPNSPVLGWVPKRWHLGQLALSKFGSRVAPDLLRRGLGVRPIEDPKIYVTSYFAHRLLGDGHRADEALRALRAMAVRGPAGVHWGYDYTWATREGAVNARRASAMVPGAFAMFALVHDDARGATSRHAELLADAGRYYASAHLREGPGGPFLGYFAHSRANTHNANLLGGAALSLVGARFGREDFLDVAARTSATSVAAVDDEGRIPYTDLPSGDWTDAFHHLYVLACVRVIARALPLPEVATYDQAAGRLEDYFRRSFFLPDGKLCYRPGERYPIDPHNHAVVALGALLLDGPGAARAILQDADAAAWDPSRRRYVHRVHRRRVDARLFLRWTQSWMLLALAAASEPDAVTRELSLHDGV